MIVGIMQQPSSEVPQSQHAEATSVSEHTEEVVEDIDGGKGLVGGTGGAPIDHPVSSYEPHHQPSLHPSQMHHQHMNGATGGTLGGPAAASQPPQQVYVNPAMGGQHPPPHHHQLHPGMTGLESQFQAALGFRQEEATAASTEPSSTQTNPNEVADEEDEVDNEGEESEGDPVKLFVGQVPRTMSEEDIFPTFDSFGPLKDVAIIRDKHTGLHRGCAFVTYWASADAQAAQEALHDKFTFPGGRRAAQVKPAEPSRKCCGSLQLGTREFLKAASPVGPEPLST